MLRQSMNDVPVQVAEDAVSQLQSGILPADVAKTTVDVRNTIDQFVIVYDKSGKVIAGSGHLNGQIPTPPHGVFDNVGFWRYGHSWQPDQDVRIDAAIIPYSYQGTEGYVLGGQNMRVMEMHIEHIGALVFGAWILLLIATFIAAGFARFFS